MWELGGVMVQGSEGTAAPSVTAKVLELHVGYIGALRG